MTRREDRIRFLARRSAGRPLLDARREAIASILKCDRIQVRLLSLEESDLAMQRFSENHAKDRHGALTVAPMQEGPLRVALADAAGRLVHPDAPVIGFFSDSRTVGAIELSVRDLWLHGIDFANLDRDLFSGWAASAGSGLLIDRMEQDDARVEYETIVWGENWKAALAAGLQHSIPSDAND
jgi:hypothetical protein